MMKCNKLYRIESEIKMQIGASIHELPASVGRQCVKTVLDLHLRQRGGKTLAKPKERDKFKTFRKRAEVKQKVKWHTLDFQIES